MGDFSTLRPIQGIRNVKAECAFSPCPDSEKHKKWRKQKAAGTPDSRDGTECFPGREINHPQTHWNCLQRAAQEAGELRNAQRICANLKRAMASNPWSNKGLFLESERS